MGDWEKRARGFLKTVWTSASTQQRTVKMLGRKVPESLFVQRLERQVGTQGQSFHITIEIVVARFGRHVVECYPAGYKDCAEGDEVGES